MDVFRRALTLALGLLLACSEEPPAESAECEATPKGRSLLQVPPKAPKAEVSELAVEEVAASPSPAAAGTVNWDGDRTFTVERKEMDGYPAEALFRVPLSELPTHNATHIFFPFKKFLDVIYVRDLHGIGSYEYGYARWMWGLNEMSAVGPGVVVGAAEKLHTLSHVGAWGKESLEKVREEQRDRWSTTDTIAETMRFPRSAGINTWALLNSMGSQLVNASVDPSIVADMYAFAGEPGLGPMAGHMAALSAKLTQKHNAYKSGLNGLPTAESTACNCFHLHAAPGLTVVSDGFWWPLNRKVTSIRGQTVFTPISRFDVMTGIAVATIKDGMLEVYQGAAQISNVLHPSVMNIHDRRKAPQLFVGPTDGAHRPIPPEGRWHPVPHSTMGAFAIHQLFSAWDTLPADYKFLSKPPEVVCPPSHLHATELELEGLDLYTMAKGSEVDQLNAVRIMTNMLDCTTDFLRGDEHDSHAYGSIEALVFLHGMLEFPSAMLLRGWNVIPEELFCGSSGCITTTTTTTTTTYNFWSWWPW